MLLLEFIFADLVMSKNLNCVCTAQEMFVKEAYLQKMIWNSYYSLPVSSLNVIESSRKGCLRDNEVRFYFSGSFIITAVVLSSFLFLNYIPLTIQNQNRSFGTEVCIGSFSLFHG